MDQANLKYQYDKVAQALRFIGDNFKQQPNLEEIAATVNLSSYHFQRMFSDWAGVSPKKFLQYLTVGYAKSVMREKETTLFDVAQEAGLSGTGRLHDLFVNVEGMTPGEYKNGGENLRISFKFYDTIFGSLLIASTQKGICRMAFENEQEDALATLKHSFPNAVIIEEQTSFQLAALGIFNADWNEPQNIKLHLKGTPFQLKVWETLLQIPLGQLTSYGKIAEKIGLPTASRAVGTAVGDNPVAYIIPCHRVIQYNGSYGQYRWGPVRKKLMIGWEASKMHIAEEKEQE